VPAPSRTGRDRIVLSAGALLEEGGADAVTMQAVAQREGVQAPSLYKHVRNRRDLLAAVVATALDELTTRLEAVRDDADPRRSIVAQVDEIRRFAHERPRAFALVIGSSPDLPRATPEAMAVSLRFLMAATSTLAGEEHALDAARLVIGWANGFIGMELADALQMGGDIDAAWTWGLQRIVAALRP
jgi:AcrR family transcriptional regulator